MNRFKWIECPACTAKLFKLYDDDKRRFAIQIKCNSCKALIGIKNDDTLSVSIDKQGRRYRPSHFKY